MHIITRRRLREFWEIDRKSQEALDGWYQKLKRLDAGNMAELHQTFPHADLVGTCTVFNVGGNKYRVITKINFVAKIVYIKNVLTHKEYDKDKWKADCG
jgi:mRNA interferase HigB